MLSKLELKYKREFIYNNIFGSISVYNYFCKPNISNNIIDFVIIKLINNLNKKLNIKV